MAAAKGNNYAAKERLMRAAVLDIFDEHKLGRKGAAMAFMRSVIDKAESGDMTAAKMVIEHIDGKPHQAIDLEAAVTVEALVFATPHDEEI